MQKSLMTILRGSHPSLVAVLLPCTTSTQRVMLLGHQTIPGVALSRRRLRWESGLNEPQGWWGRCPFGCQQDVLEQVLHESSTSCEGEKSTGSASSPLVVD